MTQTGLLKGKILKYLVNNSILAIKCIESAYMIEMDRKRIDQLLSEIFKGQEPKLESEPSNFKDIDRAKITTRVRDTSNCYRL